MGEASFACFYFFFAMMFATVNIIVQDVTVRSQMYEAVVSKYITMPYKFKPERHFDHVSVPSELYSWLVRAYIPMTFAERPVNGDPNGFCTTGHQCYINQGDCDADSQCQTGLACGDKGTLSSGMMVNGMYWDTQELVDWCNWQGRPVNLLLNGAELTYASGAKIPPQMQQCTTSPSVLGTEPPCCWDDRTNDWISLITNATDASQKKATFNFLGRGNCPTATSADGDCCGKTTAEPLDGNETAKMTAVVGDFPVTVGDFNRVLMVRFTTKRYKRVAASGGSPAFSYLMPTVLSNGGNPLQPSVDNGNVESKEAFTGAAMPVAKNYVWEKKNSWAKAGGYVEWVNPMDGEAAMGMVLERMFKDGLFDNTLATFTLDMIMYNGNSETFMHVSIQFVFDPSGACSKSYDAKFSNLKGLKGGNLYAKLIEYIFLIPTVVFFFFWEFKKMKEISPAAHFGKANSWIDMFSLLLCTTVLSMNFLISLDATYTGFRFDHNDPRGFTDKQAYLDMVDLTALISLQVYFVAINLLMIFFRSVVLVTALEANLGLIIATLGQAMVNIMYFCLTFMFLLIGFVAFAFFTFGSQPRDTGMTSPSIAFYQTFAMLLGQQDFEGLKRADPTMAIFFYFSFYIMVSFVMMNMFVSILLSGYDVCDFQIKNSRKDEQKSLWGRLVDDFTNDIFGKCASKGADCALGTWAMCIKPFFVGIMSCFLDCIKSCAGSISCPSPKKIVDSVLKGSGDVNWDKRMAAEIVRGEKNLVFSKKILPELKKTQPPEAAHLEESMKAIQGFQKSSAKKKKDAEKDKSSTGTPIFDENDFTEMREANNEIEILIEKITDKASVQEQVCMGFFMLIFVSMLILMTRGEDSFWVTKATRDPATAQTWIVPRPLRRSEFSNIDSLEEAGQWASSVLVEEMYKHPACRVRAGTTAPANIADCDNTDNNMQLVQKLSNWNIGFLNTTFVRVSIQPACYVENVASRWKGGAEYLRSTSAAGSCSSRACYADALKAEGTCRNSGGDIINEKQFPVSGIVGGLSPTYYNYSEPEADLGPIGLTGGYVVSLGSTKESARMMMDSLIADMWFTKNSASVTFDWLTYNGNIDMFTYNVVAFSLLETGALETQLTSNKFPLNVQAGGGPFHTTRVLIMVLFVIYAVMVVYFIADQISGLFKAHVSAKKSNQAPYYFVLSYYKSVWNRVDTQSLVITVTSITIYFQYLFGDPFREQYKFNIGATDKYQVPPSAVKQYGMPAGSDPGRNLQDDWFIFLQMGAIASTYDLYLNLAAVNAFFIAVKVVKYSNALKPFRIYASTLAEGSERMMYFSFVILLLLVGWSLFWMVLFGVYDANVSEIFTAVTTCFTWMLGDFDLAKMIAAREFAAILFFVLFEVMMYFICINMFLATMLNTYSETVGKMEVAMEKQRMQDERVHDFVEITYVDKQELKGDIQIKKDELGEVWVQYVKPEGKASEANVSGGGPGIGNLLLKVNGDKTEWKEHSTEEEIMEDGIAPDPRDNQIRIIFKAPRIKDKSWLETMLSVGQSNSDAQPQKIVPTVRTFWRKHGAVTFTYAEVTKSEKGAKTEPEGDQAEGDSQDGATKDDATKQKAEMGGSELKAIGSRVKKRLDMLLFSRAAHAAGVDGVDPFDISHMDTKGADAADAGEEAKVEGDIEIDELRNRIENEPVTGDEVWLDCLLTQIEHEMDDESVVTEVLRTSDMQETHRGQGPQKQDSLNNFYTSVLDILSILECKAKQKWYRCLQEESESRLTMFRKQNDILHDYACELEAAFSDIMQKIAVFKAKKDMMITKLSGLLDKGSYKHLDTSGAPEDKSHLERLSIPWPEATSSLAPALNNI